MKYLPLFHHFKAIYQFPKHLIFWVKIVANAALSCIINTVMIIEGIFEEINSFLYIFLLKSVFFSEFYFVEVHFGEGGECRNLFFYWDFFGRNQFFFLRFVFDEIYVFSEIFLGRNRLFFWDFFGRNLWVFFWDFFVDIYAFSETTFYSFI